MSAFETGNKLKIGPNGEELNKTCLTTWSHKVLDLADPQPESICIEDIAHGLSQHVRWVGQGRWLSVAQHSVMVLRWVEEHCHSRFGFRPTTRFLCDCLMHDAHEAYIGDLSGGLKYLLRDSVLKDLILKLNVVIPYAIGWDSETFSDEQVVLEAAETALVEIEYDLLFHDIRHSNVPIEGPLCQKLSEALFLEEARRLGMVGTTMVGGMMRCGGSGWLHAPSRIHGLGDEPDLHKRPCPGCPDCTPGKDCSCEPNDHLCKGHGYGSREGSVDSAAGGS